MGAVGIVLAGGLSLRMGRDKALVELAGETLVARACRQLSEVCEEVAVADNGRRLLPDTRSLADSSVGRGPAAGLLGAEGAYPDRQLLVLACDLPGVPTCLLSLLAGSAVADPEEADWVLPRWRGGIEPLCSRWGPAALAALAAQVERGDLALRAVAETSTLRIRYLDEPALCVCGEPEEMFYNLNRPDDLERLSSRGEPPGLKG